MDSNKIFKAGSDANKLETVAIHLGRNAKEVFVELSGNDESGDGSQLKPFKTVGRAILELTGTTRKLMVVLGDGTHPCGTIDVEYAYLHITGTGKLQMKATSTSLYRSRYNATVYIGVDIDDVSENNYNNFVAFSCCSSIYFYQSTINLTKAVSFLYQGGGQNAYIAHTCEINSVNPIPKLNPDYNSEDLAIAENNSTYTNITA